MIDLSIPVLERLSTTLQLVLELSVLLYLVNPFPYPHLPTMVSYSLTALESWSMSRKVQNQKLDSHRSKRLKLLVHLVSSLFLRYRWLRRKQEGSRSSSLVKRKRRKRGGKRKRRKKERKS